MTQGDNRQIPRDSLFLMADMRIDGTDVLYRIKVRNLSSGGMMGEGAVHVVRGTPIEVSVRNIGWVRGAIAWVQENRFGVAFTREIDPHLARAPVGGGDDVAPRYTKNHQPPTQPDSASLRKI